MFCGVGIINLGPGTWDVATQQVATPAGRRIKLDKIFTRKYLQLICPKLFESVTLVEAAVGSPECQRVIICHEDNPFLRGHLGARNYGHFSPFCLIISQVQNNHKLEL